MEPDVDDLDAVDADGVLGEQFQDVIEGLNNGRPPAALDAGGDLAIKAGDEGAEDRPQNHRENNREHLRRQRHSFPIIVPNSIRITIQARRLTQGVSHDSAKKEPM